MFMVQSCSVAVVFCVIAVLGWGSWANARKLAGRRWRFELFYWDHVFGLVILSTVAAFTLGNLGSDGPSVLADLRQARVAPLGMAFLAGVLFNAANLLLVAAIDIAGMAVAFPVGITAATVVAVAANCWLHPNALAMGFLAAGLELLLAAVVLDAVAYRRLPERSEGLAKKGLLLAIGAGLVLGLCYLLVQEGMSERPGAPNRGVIGPYAALCLLALGILASNLLFNRLLMARPLQGAPVTWSDYRKGTLAQHAWGVLGGMILAVGITASVLAYGPTGPAVSIALVQTAAIVAALWGVFVWREFGRTIVGFKFLLAPMFAAYLAGLLLLGGAWPPTWKIRRTAAVAVPPACEVTNSKGLAIDSGFLPTPYDVVRLMLKQADLKKDDVLCDLGCGDGRILVTAAKEYGCRGLGYDLDPDRVAEAHTNVETNGVANLVQIEQRNIFDVDVSEVTVLGLYLGSSTLEQLVPQMERLRPGARIVAHGFPIPKVRPDLAAKIRSDEDDNEHIVYLYTTPLKKTPFDASILPLPQDVVDVLLKQAALQKDDVLCDLGCGDGRMLITAARQYGCRGLGYDSAAERVAEARKNVASQRVADLVKIEQGNTFEAPLSGVNVVVLHLFPQAIDRLSNQRVKLVAAQLKQLPPGARIIIHDDGSGEDYTESGEISRTLTIKTFSDENQQEHTLYFSTKSARKP